MDIAVKQVKTRFLILSDTHNCAPAIEGDLTKAYRLPLPSSDVLLHAGDLTMEGRMAEHRRTFDVVKQAPAEMKLVIAGNHDITLDAEYYSAYGAMRHGANFEDIDAIKALWTGDEAKKHGIIYLEEGCRTFTLHSGARFTVASLGHHVFAPPD